jgi:cytochrome c oxidase subunit II
MINARSGDQRRRARTKSSAKHPAFSNNRLLASMGVWSLLRVLIGMLWLTASCLAESAARRTNPTNIFAPSATPADSIFKLSLLVLAVTGTIFVVVFSLLVYAAVKFRERSGDDREPPQIYGSNQLELAWTVLPVLIVMVLFLSSARVIHAVQDARLPPETIEVTAVGHQFWWEYRYPQYGFVTSNELHVPVSDPAHPTPTFIRLLSADTDHSFWIPRLAGKTDLIPNHPNSTWIDPHETGLYLGQCAQYCGTEHAKMLLRVYVESRADFDRWAEMQQQTVQSDAAMSPEAIEGRRVFESTACINCHTIEGTVADGHFGPNLRHLMSRDTIASGAAPNTPANLRLWIQNPNAIKPGSLMPAMNLNDKQLDEVTDYLLTLR